MVPARLNAKYAIVATESVAMGVDWMAGATTRGRMMRRIRNRGRVQNGASENRHRAGGKNPRTELVYVMTLMRSTQRVSIRRRTLGTAHGQIRSTDALRRVLLTRLTSYLEFRGRICQETLCDRSSVTFDLR